MLGIKVLYVALMGFSVASASLVPRAYSRTSPTATAPYPGSNSTTATSISTGTLPTPTEGCDPQGCFSKYEFSAVFWWDHAIFLGDPDNLIHLTLYGAGQTTVYHQWQGCHGWEHVETTWLPQPFSVNLEADKSTGECLGFNAETIHFQYFPISEDTPSRDKRCSVIEQTPTRGTIRCVLPITME